MSSHSIVRGFPFEYDFDSEYEDDSEYESERGK